MLGLIIVNPFRLLEANKYKIKRFKEEFKIYNIELDVLTSLDLGLSITNGQIVSKIDLTKYSFCLFLDKDENVAFMLEKFMRVFNSSEAIKACNDKFETFLKLSNYHLNLAKTIPNPLCYSTDVNEEAIERFLNTLEEEFNYPLVCKASYGSLGLQVYLIKSREELETKYLELLHTPHLYQEFIENSCGRDFRIFTVNHKVVASMERVNLTDFRSNIALGGKGYPLVPEKPYIELAEKVSEILNLDFGGIDILIGKDNTPVLAEVNSNAFFSEIENVSKINVTKLIVEYVISVLK